MKNILKLNKNLLPTMMSAVLFIAGITHLALPSLFLPAMPPYIPFHLELIYLTGTLEFLFALGLLNKEMRRASALLLMLYFIAILPAHIHVSLNGIEMFGITNKFLLWIRTVFQSVFIYWAWRIAKLS
jgi:uncharacterized membrane protein